MNMKEQDELRIFTKDFDEFKCTTEFRLDNLEKGQEKIITNELPHLKKLLDEVKATIKSNQGNIYKALILGFAIIAILVRL